MNSDDHNKFLFEEIFAPDDKDNQPSSSSVIDAWVVTVEPKVCGPLVKRLSKELPLKVQKDDETTLIDLSHLKRVRRTTTTVTTTAIGQQLQSSSSTSQNDENERKRKRDAIKLEVLLGSAEYLNDQKDDIVSRYIINGQNVSNSDEHNKIDVLSTLVIKTVQVPARQADTEVEWKRFNNIWPMTYFPNKTKEYRIKEMQLTENEIDQMKFGIQEAITDSNNNDNNVGVVILSPLSGKVIATASQERQKQNDSIMLLQQKCFNDDQTTLQMINPLSTSIILAIQAVSRLEREVAISVGGMNNESFQKGQYLCTGLDVYTTKEPTVYEAMALVHSRIRRLVFIIDNKTDTNIGTTPSQQDDPHDHGITKYHVNALPGTNHHYRAFTCQIHR